ncbi:MAG: bifunctional pyr operon transcriptional regulator/uracil phosphoribosyltransferase PyrR [Methylococcaceae bacterium]|nr:bifunctional pyr operon transcriptional regulator/uracil phosphoribosyltransferase PyrR [Methylococcaceae bacterium]MCI0732262.1 bifunctional pyr operon transcriptional regulator/uracil phosphoribosyltransferase PyrR [Methylococcaceae bacterium]
MAEPAINANAAIANLAQSLLALIQERCLVDPLMIGIHTGGAWIAGELHRRLEIREPLGLLDISFYRDDFSRIGVNPEIRPSSLPFDVEGRQLLLIDDVLYTGRTIRAALNEIFDYGRPDCVVLGVLIERDGREVPIQADCVGSRVSLKKNQRVELTGPDPLRLDIQTVAAEVS